MSDFIKLTKDELIKIKYEDVIAFFISEGGAMGEPNVCHTILKDLTHYYINLYDRDFSKEEFFTYLPVLSSFDCFCEVITGLDKNWQWYNAGFGNYLIVRDNYTEKVDKYIKENFKENWEHGELYQKWFNMIKEIV